MKTEEEEGGTKFLYLAGDYKRCINKYINRFLARK
jgi:hypothetical protein